MTDEILKHLVVKDLSGEPAVKLNHRLVEQTSLTDAEVINIKVLHKIRLAIIEYMKQLDPKEDLQELKNLYKLYIDNQYDLQLAWGFTADPSYHDWFEVPHCTCPKMDNRERKGTKYQIYNQDCPFHGWEA